MFYSLLFKGYCIYLFLKVEYKIIDSKNSMFKLKRIISKGEQILLPRLRGRPCS